MEHGTRKITWAARNSGQLEAVGCIGEHEAFRLSFHVDFHSPEGFWEGGFLGRFISLRGQFPDLPKRFESLDEGIAKVTAILQESQGDISRIDAAKSRAQAELDNLNSSSCL